MPPVGARGEQIRQVARYIDASADNYAQVREVATAIRVPELLQEHRKFVMSGAVMFKKKMRAVKRHLYLFSDLVLVAASKGRSGRLKVRWRGWCEAKGGGRARGGG